MTIALIILQYKVCGNHRIASWCTGKIWTLYWY